jgi:hypothetical protein
MSADYQYQLLEVKGVTPSPCFAQPRWSNLRTNSCCGVGW